MGYCWTSGEKVNGRWKFLECNGNQSRNGSCYPESADKQHPRCRDCVQWCPSYTEAVKEVERYDKDMADYHEVN